MKEKVNNVDVNAISSEIKEETKNMLKTLLGEAVHDFMKESIIKEANKDEDDDTYEIEDVDDNIDDDKADKDSVDAPDATDSDDSDSVIDSSDDTTDSSDDVADADDTDIESSDETDSSYQPEDDDSKWSEFDQYKIDDDNYDFTGVEDDDTIIKVYKLLNDDDQVVVKQNGNKVNIKDNETDAEYVIEIDPDSIDDDTMSSSSDDMGSDFTDESVNEDVNLGYTDNYQDEDPIQGLSMNEPAKSSNTASWDKGVPTGTKKPWAGKGKDSSFDKPITEENEDVVPANSEGEGNVEEITTVTSNNARKMPKTHTSEPRRNNLPYGSKHISASGKYDDAVVEAILKKARAIQEDNKHLKQLVGKIKNALQEAATLNVSLGGIVRLFNENTTTSQEKKMIIERFSKVNNVKESRALYETIKHELNKEQKQNVVLEKQMTTNSSAKINETPIYQSKAVKDMIDLINRVEKC